MKVLKKKLLSQMGKLLSLRYDFSKKAVGQSFIKNIADGRQSVHLAFIQHENDFDATIDVAIRFDTIENLINEDNKLLSAKEKKSTYTMGVELGNLIQGIPKRWTIYNEANIEHVVNEMLDWLERYGKSYFDKYSEMKNAFEVLSRNDKDGWRHCPIHGVRAKRALAMAKILGFQSTIPDLIKEGSAFLQQMKDFGLNDYIHFSKRFE